MDNVEKGIVKREKAGNLILFFPDEKKGIFIPCFTFAESHNEANYDYYRKCEPVDYDTAEVMAFAVRYQNYVRKLPYMGNYTLKLV